MELLKKNCKEVDPGTPPLHEAEIIGFLKECSKWLEEGSQIHREFEFSGFKEALEFVNKVGNIAIKEDHHPDIELHWHRVIITLWTHTIKGLSENDFIIAAKIDQVFEEPKKNLKHTETDEKDLDD